jgi:hypothetical protein
MIDESRYPIATKFRKPVVVPAVPDASGWHNPRARRREREEIGDPHHPDITQYAYIASYKVLLLNNLDQTLARDTKRQIEMYEATGDLNGLVPMGVALWGARWYFYVLDVVAEAIYAFSYGAYLSNSESHRFILPNGLYNMNARELAEYNRHAPPGLGNDRDARAPPGGEDDDETNDDEEDGDAPF